MNKLKRRGFTLLEMLIVLAILGLLIGVAVVNVTRILGDSEEAVARLFVKETIRTPLVTYRINMGSYPSTSQGLEALVRAPEGGSDRWRGPYVDGGSIPLDPWGNPYQYRYPGEHNSDGYDVWSFGPDGVDSDKNIGNW